MGEDLASATLRDARRSLKRRRLATYAIAFALLVITGTAAIANGWLFSETTASQAVPSLGEGAEAKVLLKGLGPERRSLSSVTTAGGAICITLTGFQMQCIPTFTGGQQLAWFEWSSQAGPTLVWGIVRDEVTSVEAVTTDGRRTLAQLANGGFYLELSDGLPSRLVAHLANGSSDSVAVAPCAANTPDCPD